MPAAKLKRQLEALGELEARLPKPVDSREACARYQSWLWSEEQRAASGRPGGSPPPPVDPVAWNAYVAERNEWLAAFERARQEYAAATVDGKLAIKRAELAEVEAWVPPWDGLNTPKLMALRADHLKADIAELEGASPEVVREMHERADGTFNGRPYEEPAPPKPLEFGADAEPGTVLADGTLVVSKRKAPAVEVDRLESYRGDESHKYIEPRYV